MRVCREMSWLIDWIDRLRMDKEGVMKTVLDRLREDE